MKNTNFDLNSRIFFTVFCVILVVLILAYFNKQLFVIEPESIEYVELMFMGDKDGESIILDGHEKTILLTTIDQRRPVKLNRPQDRSVISKFILHTKGPENYLVLCVNNGTQPDSFSLMVQNKFLGFVDYTIGGGNFDGKDVFLLASQIKNRHESL